MIAEQPLVNALGVVEHGDVEIGVEDLELIEVKRRKQPMPPAERGVCVNEHVLVLIRRAQDLLEYRPAERIDSHGSTTIADTEPEFLDR